MDRVRERQIERGRQRVRIDRVRERQRERDIERNRVREKQGERE